MLQAWMSYGYFVALAIGVLASNSRGALTMKEVPFAGTSFTLHATANASPPMARKRISGG